MRDKYGKYYDACNLLTYNNLSILNLLRDKYHNITQENLNELCAQMDIKEYIIHTFLIFTLSKLPRHMVIHTNIDMNQICNILKQLRVDNFFDDILK